MVARLHGIAGLILLVGFCFWFESCTPVVIQSVFIFLGGLCFLGIVAALGLLGVFLTIDGDWPWKG